MHEDNGPEKVREIVEAIYRADSRRVLATLIRLLGHFELAEEALHDAFTAAMDQWSRDGVPDNPRAWLISTGRFKAIEGLRRRARFDASIAELTDRIGSGATNSPDQGVEDDRLRLIFICCHPALSPDAQLALTLREVCGLTTEEVARVFLTTAPAIAKRIVRAKAKIREARIPYEVPGLDDLPHRLDSVLQVVYLLFTEGYSATAGGLLTRPDISGEAIRLGRLLMELLPQPEVTGLLALMLLHESRRQARTSPDGELVLLSDQDRSLWNWDQIAEGIALAERALAARPTGQYAVQGAIAAVHANAQGTGSTDWVRIVDLYDLLLQVAASPIVELNRVALVPAGLISTLVRKRPGFYSGGWQNLRAKFVLLYERCAVVRGRGDV